MTGISFHVNLADPLAYACRLLRKASTAGARVIVTGRPEQLQGLDTTLWTFSATDFIAHGLAQALPPAVRERTPIVLSALPHDAGPREVLVNLANELPRGFEAFERLIELVSSDEADLQQARVRWKHYADRGYEVTKVDQKGVTA